MKDKEWLKEELLRELMRFNDNPNMADYERGISSGIGTAINLAEKLDEPKKPVIPQFVAEYIEQSKKDNDSINQVFAFMDDKEDKDLWHWLDGYEVEKEKKYYVYDSTTDSYLGFNGDRTKLGWYYYIVNKESFTEAEIKDYDERYWAFAQEVTQ